MINKIKLDNKYCLELEENDIGLEGQDIRELKAREIIRNKYLILKIDFNTLDEKDYKKIIKRVLHIKALIKLHAVKIGIEEKTDEVKLGYVINYDKNNKRQNEFILAINAIFFKTRYDRYNYIYDTVCNYLDYGKNLCDFQDNKCGEKRNTSSTWGCCRHYKIKWLGPFSKFTLCEYLKEDYTCAAKCLGCKLYTCDYLRKKGIKFKMKDILLLNAFFNPLQKYFIKYMVFTPKEKVIRRLMIT